MSEIRISRIIAVGAPLVLSIVCLLLGYGPRQDRLPLVIMGWGSVFLTILVAYHEWYQAIFLRAIKQRHQYGIMQERNIPVLMQIKGLIGSAKPGEEIFSTATFRFSKEYEEELVDKIVELASAASADGQTVFTRILSNASKPAIKQWINEIKDPNHEIYSRLHEYVKSGLVRIYTCGEAVGLDLLMLAGENRKVAVIGVKEESPEQYANNYFAKLISRGNTFVFENDAMAESIYNYYGRFICACLEQDGRRMTV